MSANKPRIGKREMKRISKSEVSDRFIRIGDEIDEPIHVEERRAGAVRYNVVKFLSEDNQAIVAVYGSMKHLCAVWVKEDTFATIKPLLPDDAVVEDVEIQEDSNGYPHQGIESPVDSCYRQDCD